MALCLSKTKGRYQEVPPKNPLNQKMSKSKSVLEWSENAKYQTSENVEVIEVLTIITQPLLFNYSPSPH